MCVQLPCGYSSQTLTKIIAYCGITVYASLTIATALVGLIIEGKEDLRSEYSNVGEDIRSDNESEYTTENFTDVPTTDVPLFGTPDTEYDDLTHFLEMQMSDPVKVCMVIWIVLNFLLGLVINIILLQGAQERNSAKVKLSFYLNIGIYLLWIPIYAYWVCHSVEPVNTLMVGFMIYMVGGFCLWVVAGFIEELRIESINHRAGYKDMLVPFYKI